MGCPGVAIDLRSMRGGLVRSSSTPMAVEHNKAINPVATASRRPRVMADVRRMKHDA